MDEKKVQELWLAFKDGNELGSLQEFKGFMSDPKNRADFHAAFKDSAELGDINQFEDYLGVKKKVSSKGSGIVSSTQPPVRTAEKKSNITEGDGIQINWDTGKVSKSAFQKNAESVYELTVTSHIRDSEIENAPTPQYEQDPASPIEAANALFQTANRGFYKTGVGGTLRGSGEAVTKFHNWLFDDNADVKDSWLYQAGTAIQEKFPELTARKDLTEGTLGQVGDASGQLLLMIATAPEAIASKAPGASGMLKTAASQLFSRSTAMATMQMLDQEATNIRNEKQLVESIDRDSYVSEMQANGVDTELAKKKYDKLKSSDPDDIISDMLPSIIGAGATEIIPLSGFFKRANKVSNGAFGKVFMEKARDVTVGTFEGAAQEALQDWMMNASAKEVYDFTRKATEGLEQSAKVGGAVQFIFEITSAAIGIKNRGYDGPDKELLEKAASEIESKKEVLAKNLETEVVSETPIASVKKELDSRVASGEITQQEADDFVKDISTKKTAIEKTPEDQRSNPDVVEVVVEKTKVDEEIAAKKEAIKSIDPAFQQDAKNEIAALEVKSAELSLQVAEKAGVTPDEKAMKLLEPKEGEQKPVAKEPEPPKMEPVTSGELEIGMTYYNEQFDRNYVFAGVSESGMLIFDKVQKKGEPPLMTIRTESLPDSPFMKKMFGEKGEKGQQVAPIQEPTQPELQGELPETVPAEPIVAEIPQEVVAEAVAQDEGDTSSKNVGKRLRGFYANSLKKMGGASPGQGVLAKIAKADPQFYEPMSRSGNAQTVANEIDSDGLETVVQRAMLDNTGEPEGVVAARRIVSLIAIGDAMADANRANDTQTLDIMRNQARELERLLGKKGTEFGQALSMYAIYSQTPEGQLAARLRDIEEKRERTRTRMTEGGRQVGDVVDSIVADVAAEVGITKAEAEQVLANVFGKKKAKSAAKATIAKGKKEVEEARVAIRNIMLGRANVGLPVAQYAKAGKEFIKLFSGYAKIYKGNIQKIRTAFRKDVNDAGLNGTAAYEWLESNHPEITGPITDFHNKMLEAIVGFYNGDIKGDLKSALEKVGLTEAEAIAVSEDFAAQWGEELAKKKASRLKQIVRTHVKSAKKARVIENGLLEAITIGGLNDDAIRRKLEEKYGIKSFTNEQINELNQMVMDMKDMPSRGQKFKQMREMMDYIHLHGGIDVTSFFAATWYAKVLFSLKTMLSVGVGNEVNFWDNFIVHGLATDGGIYAMKESVKRLVQPIASKLNIMAPAQQERGLMFGLAEGWRFVRTGEASREMKKVARSADLELVSRMSFVEAGRDFMTSLGGISESFKDVMDADTFAKKMDEAKSLLAGIGRSGYLLAKAFAIPHSRVFKYSLRAISAADSLRYYSMLDFTLDRKAYNSAVAEGLEGKAAEVRAKEILGETIQASKEIYDQAVQDFTDYAAQRGKQLNEMFKDVDIAYRAREIAEERLDEAWRKVMERDASLQGQFDDAVQKVMASNPGMSQKDAEKTARRMRQRYNDNQSSPTEQARFEAEKVALQNDPQGVMGKLAKLLSADFPAMFDEKINAPEPELTGDKNVDEFNAARYKAIKSVAKAFKTYSSFVFPFMKTMANVINMKIERFPVLGGVMKGIDSVVGAPSIDWNNMEQRRVFFARQLAGNIILLSMFMYIKSKEDDDEPVITLTGPKDFAKKQGEIETKVWKKETIVVGGKRFYFGDTPYAAVLGFMGLREDKLKYAKEGEDDWTTGTMTMALLTQMFTNASYMQTFSNMSTAMQEQDAAKFGAALASPVSGMASSGLQRDLDRWLSPELRDRATIENRFIGEMVSRTPFASNYLLDFRYNSIGEVIDPYENESVFTQAIGLDKYISSTEVSNPIFEVLAEKKVRFKGIGKSIDILGTDATYQEKRDYTLFVGRYRNKVLSANLQAMKEMGTEQLEMQLDKTDAEGKRAAELFILLQRKDKANPDLGQSKDVSIEAIDRFISDYDPEMVKEDSKMFMEELKTEKPEAEVDESLFF